MKILYFAANYQAGHTFFDDKMIDILSKVGELYVLSPKDWYQHKDNVVYIEEAVYKKAQRFPHLSLFSTTLKNYIKCSKVAKRLNVDLVVAGEYELISILFFNIIAKNKVCLINHYNIDQIERSTIFRTIFNLVKNRFYHIALEDYIKEYVGAKYAVEDKVFCWRHPMEEKAKICKIKNYDCIGLSGSNDEDYIDKLISLEKSSNSIKSSGLKVLLKSKNLEYSNDNLTVIKGNIEHTKFIDIFNSANNLFMPLPASYNYRVSAVILEGANRHIPAIGTNVELVKYYKKKYPNIFEVVNGYDLSDAIRALNEKDEKIKSEEFEAFYNDHSDEVVIKEIRESIGKILDND